ncbi:phosphotransferase [Asticcacaulis sp. ZE23SCel15]|uniref:phosphotransferase n=1 Tax=Asticcacaulis sp. ZE23SCel15 TaxID=3059027 RepID=UPI00265F1460|nr:phosphotransferase [Asticcacaulis sp. ZE23SCel15]WKL57343.1 phosphotransferase [Asticcacaulis sp. ZE23SCel15]
MTANLSEASLSDTHVPRISAERAQAIARQHYGLKAEARELTGERDRNFHLKAAQAEYVLKISSALEDPATTAFQNAMLRRLEGTGTDVPIPRLVPTIDGADEALIDAEGGAHHIVRLVTYLSGTPLAYWPPSHAIRIQVAQISARMVLALEDFSSPYSDTDMLWNIARADRIRPLLSAVEDRAVREVSEAVFARFDDVVAPTLAALPAQFIHNDLNLHNLIIGDGGLISGVIDFGDAVKSHAVCDLATAAAYQLFDVDDPITALSEMVAAFHAVRPLTEAEIELIFDLVRARWAITVGIAHWRARRHPANGVYIMRNAPRSITALMAVAELSPSDVADKLKTACQRSAT